MSTVNQSGSTAASRALFDSNQAGLFVANHSPVSGMLRDCASDADILAALSSGCAAGSDVPTPAEYVAGCVLVGSSADSRYYRAGYGAALMLNGRCDPDAVADAINRIGAANACWRECVESYFVKYDLKTGKAVGLSYADIRDARLDMNKYKVVMAMCKARAGGPPANPDLVLAVVGASDVSDAMRRNMAARAAGYAVDYLSEVIDWVARQQDAHDKCLAEHSLALAAVARANNAAEDAQRGWVAATSQINLCADLGAEGARVVEKFAAAGPEVSAADLVRAFQQVVYRITSGEVLSECSDAFLKMHSARNQRTIMDHQLSDIKTRLNRAADSVAAGKWLIIDARNRVAAWKATTAPAAAPVTAAPVEIAAAQAEPAPVAELAQAAPAQAEPAQAEPAPVDIAAAIAAPVVPAAAEPTPASDIATALTALLDALTRLQVQFSTQ